MVFLLALGAAAVFGVADFLGGLATKRIAVLRVVAGSHLIGLVGVTIASLLIAEQVTPTDLILGGLAGALGAIGVGLLYRRLAIGPMGIVAPLTAVTSASVPALWGLATGESLALRALVGIGLALAAIILVSSSVDDPNSSGAQVTPAVILESLLAGASFGLFFVAIDYTDPASAPWPIAGSRLFTSVLLSSAVVVFWVRDRRSIQIPEPNSAAKSGGWMLVGITGLLDTLANVLVLLALGRGDLSIVAVLSALYPIATAAMAWLILNERINLTQRTGFVLAMGATVLIASG